MTPVANAHTINFLFDRLREDECLELRVLEPNGAPGAPGTGYFRDPNKLLTEAARLTRAGGNAYVTINPVSLDLAARSGLDKVTTKKGVPTTADKDVSRRTHLLFDLDYSRPAGIAASDQELQAALALAHSIADTLQAEGWPRPVIVNSGNGAHLLSAIDLPNTPEALDLVKRVLKRAQERFCGPNGVKVDQSVFNAARISRLPGTLNRKGAGTPERPHRPACILEAPEPLAIVPEALLEAFAGPRPAEVKTTRANGAIRNIVPRAGAGAGEFDIEEFIGRHLPGAKGPEPCDGGRKWKLPVCPWNPEHTNQSAFVIERENGALAAGCRHDSCRDKKWDDLRALFEPERQLKKRKGRPPSKDDAGVTDYDNAAAFLAENDHILRYCHDAGAWYVFDGQRWVFDDAGLTRNLWNAFANGQRQQAGQRARWSKALNNGRAKAGLETATSFAEIGCRKENFDQDPMLLCVQNGTIDLATGHLRPHDAQDMLSKQVPAKYRPDASCPLWERFLLEIMAGDVEMVSYLKRVAGYAITGSMREQKFWVFVGKGNNGKSVLMEVLLELLGDYAGVASAGTFADQRENAGPRPDLVSLIGTRLISCPEIASLDALNVALIKRWTAGDQQTARALYSKAMKFNPTGKPFFVSNETPTLKDASNGIWRRLQLVRFPVDFTGRENDRLKEELLEKERDGILRWAVEGAVEWHQNGLKPPQQVINETLEYRYSQDPIGHFLADKCFMAPDAWSWAKDIYEAYQRWSIEKGDNPISQTAFGCNLRAKDLQNVKKKMGWAWVGVGLTL